MIRIEKREDGGVGLDGMTDEADGFLEHGGAELGELREVAFTFFREGRDVADVQPLASELGGQSADAFVRDHSTGFRAKSLGVGECAGSGEIEKCLIGCG